MAPVLTSMCTGWPCTNTYVQMGRSRGAKVCVYGLSSSDGAIQRSQLQSPLAVSVHWFGIIVNTIWRFIHRQHSTCLARALNRRTLGSQNSLPSPCCLLTLYSLSEASRFLAASRKAGSFFAALPFFCTKNNKGFKTCTMIHWVTHHSGDRCT